MRLTLPRNRSLLRCAAAGRLRKLDAAAEESEKSVVDALRHQLDGDSVERCYGRRHGLDDTDGEQRRRTCREWKHVLCAGGNGCMQKMETGFSLQTQTGKGMTRTKAHQDDFLGLLTKISQ